MTGYSSGCLSRRGEESRTERAMIPFIDFGDSGIPTHCCSIHFSSFPLCLFAILKKRTKADLGTPTEPWIDQELLGVWI